MIKTKSELFRKPSIFSSFKNIIAAESTRYGGVSSSPYSSLNLGLYTKDDPVNVAENRARFFGTLGFEEAQVAGAFQVHKDEILNVQQAGQFEGYDALISNKHQLFLTVTIADCTPILIYDSFQNAIAAIHAGWRGTVAQIGPKTIREMGKHFGTKAKDCFAYIGTCIDECSFEVDADVADHFQAPFKRWDEQREKFFVDLKQTNYNQLTNIGLPAEQIELSSYSTFRNNEAYFSYRKEGGKTGRMLAVIGIY